MDLTPVTKVTITEQIMEQLANQITSGNLKPGEQLPTERDLAEIFNVTRGRVREALRALSLIGMIIIKPGGGSFVCNKDVLIPNRTISWMYHEELNNLKDIYSARRLIESEIYLSCFDIADRQTIIHIQKLVSQLDSQLSPVAFLDQLNNLDLYVSSKCGNGVYHKLMQTLVLLRSESSVNILGSDEAKLSAIEHRKKIVSAFEKNNRILLEKRLADFFDNSLNYILDKDQD
ncbi:GntR family transcriptional regulator [Candidatus Epulonipiscioides saccharophilum]|nr:GntR family transcriptional regulator [Epulopiscium sp. SCG-B10WGA-EpuloB]